MTRYKIAHIRADADLAVCKMAETYFESLQDSGLAKDAFYDGSVKSKFDFLQLAFNSQVMLFLILDAENDFVPCGHFHLVGFMGRTATIHFSISPDYLGKKSIILARESLKLAFGLNRTDGTPLLIAILGVTPLCNKLAIRFIKAVGFKEQFILPESCDFLDGSFRDGMVTLLRTGEI